ncbi:U1 small nuclear ribonucleoprotein [Xylogone sp. PMI_703]|nr:U1 small nuclear ribonucleoprotein [Xylogone sp. PMI_703]
MTDKLPPNLLALFAPRPPLRWVPPSDHAPEDRRTANISGVGAFMEALQEYKDQDDYEPTESWLQRKDRVKMEKKQQHEQLLKEGPLNCEGNPSSNYKPSDDPNIRGDAFKTLIVARLSYDATEQDLESEFGRFGPIERIRIVVDTHQHEKPNKKKKKHRGYAFIVFEREKDMRGILYRGNMTDISDLFVLWIAALDNCDGIRIKDRRIKVDVERGRTVKGWKPRRLGGGLGGRGYTKAIPPRPVGPGGFGGSGFRGGFRGGFEGGRGRGGFRSGFPDRGGYGGGRGGIGYQGSGFGPRGGDRPGYGGPNGYGAPPNAPAGPGGRGPQGNGYSRGHGGSGPPDRNGPSGPSGPSGGYDSRGSGRSYDDRSGGYRGGDRYGDRGPPRSGSGSNMEPVRPRDSGYRDRDGEYVRPREDDTRKRGYEGSGYEDPRKLRRY